MSDLFNTGVRPAIDQHLLKLAAEKRDYGEYWSASSSGYCMRRNIFERLKVPYVTEDARKQRIFTSGNIFHEWMQRITKEAGLSIAQELELQDEDLMIRGHIDDLVLVGETYKTLDPATVKPFELDGEVLQPVLAEEITPKHLILYDYKTQNSRAFSYKRPNMSYFHKMQLGTYMYMLRGMTDEQVYGNDDFIWEGQGGGGRAERVRNLTEARILKISKDDLRMSEEQLMWSDDLEEEVRAYWTELNKWWADKKMPPCTCADHEGGFLAREQYNPFYYEKEPCSLAWYEKWKKEQKK